MASRHCGRGHHRNRPSTNSHGAHRPWSPSSWRPGTKSLSLRRSKSLSPRRSRRRWRCAVSSRTSEYSNHRLTRHEHREPVGLHERACTRMVPMHHRPRCTCTGDPVPVTVHSTPTPPPWRHRVAPTRSRERRRVGRSRGLRRCDSPNVQRPHGRRRPRPERRHLQQLVPAVGAASLTRVKRPRCRTDRRTRWSRQRAGPRDLDRSGGNQACDDRDVVSCRA